MKKPTPKQDTQKGNTRKDTGGKTNAQTLNKALEIGKSLISAGSGLIDLSKEVERTKQARIKADAEVKAAMQVTEQHRINANVEHREIYRKGEKDRMDHVHDMRQLEIERENNVELNRLRERLIDKLVEDPQASKAQLADTYRALLTDDKKR